MDEAQRTPPLNTAAAERRNACIAISFLDHVRAGTDALKEA